ncbi:MAG: hypothetical protein LC679_01280 [Intrasporangiaceae bacterium]|nr:hypothetical protein [Intrasporangiaceae bacterium]
MSTYTYARRGRRFGGRAVTLSAALFALTVGAPVTAQAGLAHRLDAGEPVRTTQLVDDRSLRAPCSQLPEVDSAPVRDTHLWSYAEDGTLQLRVNGVVQRHRPPPL